MIAVELRIELPEDLWVASVSQSFPDATFRLLSGIRTGDRATELGAIEGSDPERAGAAVAAHPAIESHTALGASEERLLARYETTHTHFYEFAAATEVAPEFPFAVRDGRMDLDVRGTRDDLDRLRETLENAGLAYELLSIVESPDATALLTDRQREVLETALRAGYFEVPRDATLAEVAETIGVDTSTASGVLRRGQARILKWYLTAGGE